MKTHFVNRDDCHFEAMYLSDYNMILLNDKYPQRELLPYFLAHELGHAITPTPEEDDVLYLCNSYTKSKIEGETKKRSEAILSYVCRENNVDYSTIPRPLKMR